MAIEWREVPVNKALKTARTSRAEINGPFLTAEVTEMRDGNWKASVNGLPLPNPYESERDAKKACEIFTRILVEETLYDVIQRPVKTGPTKSVKAWLKDE
jgi:hypothetical protein